MVGLVLSGLTAFPLPWEAVTLCRRLGLPVFPGNETYSTLGRWLMTVRDGLVATDARYPFIAYGTDWLAFGHIVIALMFIGPIREPVRNVWVVRWGLIACILVVPLALICGPIRGVPFEWRLIDCSFGVVGLLPLLFCLRDIRELERIERAAK